MNTTPCRDCGNEVSVNAYACPRCGAPRPWQKDWTGTGVDWKTTAMVGNLPLVHVAFGQDKAGKRRVARGVIAIGQYGIGYITIAQFGAGIVGITQFGACAIGLSQFGIGIALLSQFAVAGWALAQLGVVLVAGKGQFIYSPWQ